MYHYGEGFSAQFRQADLEMWRYMSAAYPFGYPLQLAREKLEPGAIFGAAKPAIALVFAGGVTRSEKPERSDSPSPRFASRRQPISPHAVRDNLRAFV
jgi:hypothetical protein